MQLINNLYIHISEKRHAYSPVLFIITLYACGEQEPVELKQAASVIKYMMSPHHLSRSSFPAIYPDPKPSQFVSYLFSDMGAVEWPYAEADGNLFDGDEIERKQMQALGAPMVPGNVVFIPLRKDPGQGQQLVVKFDDTRGVVIVEGYLNPAIPPVLRREWPLPENITPAPY